MCSTQPECFENGCVCFCPFSDLSGREVLGRAEFLSRAHSAAVWDSGDAYNGLSDLGDGLRPCRHF